jgi:hypothetical protein
VDTLSKGEEGIWKLGLWLREQSRRDIGYVTFYDPTTVSSEFLGHGLADADTVVLIA